jgi:hypothetical protein
MRGACTEIPPSFHRFSTAVAVAGYVQRATCYVQCATRATSYVLRAAVLICLAVPASANDAVLYRIFLRDGSTMVSYGDYARVGDRVVLSVPIGTGERAQLQLVSISEASVDWALTERYAEAARARHYADTRGEDEFNLLSNDVARALNEVALTSDPAQRIALADKARQQLADWPASHYGYRATDVAQLSTLLDEVVSELRVAAGQSRFDLKLVAPTVVPPTVEVLPPPSLRESIELAFTAARVSSEPAERVSLLESIVRTLESGEPVATGTDGGAGTPDTWLDAAKVRATTQLMSERRVDQAYADLSQRTLTRARDRARRADVRAIDDLVRTVLAADEKLGRARPGEVAALLVAIDAQKASAQRLRLARDAWSMRAGVLRAYRRKLSGPLERLTRLKGWLEDVRQLAGPAPTAVGQLEERATIAGRELALVKPPTELEAVHALFSSASTLATRAAAARRRAIVASDMPAAFEASSAAAGALMMLERGLADLQRLIERPTIR